MESNSRTGVSSQIFIETVSNLRSLKSRAVLALVGVAIGTAAVIAMLHVGYNAKAEALRQFESLGIDLVLIVPVVDGASHIVSSEVVQALPRADIGIREAAAIVQSAAQIRAGRASVPVSALSATDHIYGLTNARLVQGRFTSDVDGFAPFAVIGAGIAATIEGASGKHLGIGDTITASGQIFTIIGMLAPSERNPVLGIDLDDAIITPFLAARRLTNSPVISSVAARLAPGADDIVTSAAVKTYLEPHLRGGTVSVQTARQIIRSIEEQMRIYAVLLLGIGTVSLIVGGVGVMNVMLMSVIERRQEIGLRQALGARRKDIRLMFLTEALVLSLVGSVFGILVGYAAGWIFAFTSGWQFQPAPMAVPFDFGMAIIVGLFFGIYPATRAARMEPVAALRAE